MPPDEPRGLEADLMLFPERHFAVLVFPNPEYRSLRFLFRHHGDLRAVAWAKFGSDGSFYLNPRIRDATQLIRGEGINDGDGGFQSLELEETAIEGVELARRKTSYHASGRVTGHRGVTESQSLREITEPTLVRQDQFAPASRFEVIAPDAMRTTDLVVPDVSGEPFELDDRQPLKGRTIVAPLRDGRAQVVGIDTAGDTHQTALVFPGVALKGCQDLTYQVLFFRDEPDDLEFSYSAVLNLAQETPPEVI